MPGGCVNGGGQLRPSEAWRAARTDVEGMTRNWAESGVSVEADGVVGGGSPSSRWGDKEWTREVEKAYWDGEPAPHGLPTPPASPKMEPLMDGLGAAREDLRRADEQAVRVLVETCGPRDVGACGGWGVEMDRAAEERRCAMYRTQYRAVESEVVGLAVKW